MKMKMKMMPMMPMTTSLSSLISVGACWGMILLLIAVTTNNHKYSMGVAVVQADTVVIQNGKTDGGEFVYETEVLRNKIRQLMNLVWIQDRSRSDNADEEPMQHHALVTQKDGAIWMYENGDLSEEYNSKKKILQIETCTFQEMALNTIVVHPKFGFVTESTTVTTTNDDDDDATFFDYVYVYYVAPGRKTKDCTPMEDYNFQDPEETDEETVEDRPHCRLSRFTYNAATQTFGQEKILLRTGNANKKHSGGGLAFGKDGKIYLATGDAGYPRTHNPSNRLDNLWGKILRLNDDGTVPMDNPYMDDTSDDGDAPQQCGRTIINPTKEENKNRICSEIFASGLRNPFSLNMNPNTEPNKVEFYVTEVGRGDWEEINIGGTGYEKANYGWREREGPCKMGRRDSNDCDLVDPSKYQDPIHFYENNKNTGAAVVGGAFIPNGIWPSDYDNEFLYSDLRSNSLFHMKYEPDHECRGQNCTVQKSKYVPTPIIDDMDGRGSLRLSFGPHVSNGKSNPDQLSLYHILYDSGTINRLTYIKKKSPGDNDIMNSNIIKPVAVVHALYSSNSDGVTVHFDGSRSHYPDSGKRDDLKYEWDFGDENHDDISNKNDTNSFNIAVAGMNDAGDAKTSHTYQKPGAYTAALTVSDSKGMMRSMKEFVQIKIDDDYYRSSDNDFGRPTLETFKWFDGCEDNKDENMNNTERIDFCGIIEFCYDEGKDMYGYHQRPQEDYVIVNTTTAIFRSFTPNTQTCESALKTKGSSPVIRMKAGHTYRLTIRNLSKDPTNIHTHGLHVVGSGSGDDVTRFVESEGCMDYIWDLRTDHPGGTYWYHPHAHSFSERQVNGGAVGLLIVEDNNEEGDTAKNDNDGNLTIKISSDDDNDNYDENNRPTWTKNELLLQVLRLDDGHAIVSNGRSYEHFNIVTNEWYRLRVSTVDPLGVSHELHFREGGTIPLNCDVHKVASDGVWHSVVPFDDDDIDDLSKKGIFPMSGSSRGDFAIRCSYEDDDDGHENQNQNEPFMNILFGNKLVAIINVKHLSSASNTDSIRKNSKLGRWVPNRPPSIRNMMTENVQSKNKFSIEVTRDSINNKLWNKDVPVKQLAYNNVHEWELPNTLSHPFHMHLYHMQIVEEGGCGNGYKEGEFYDTICTDQPCRVRFRTSDFGQRLVVHCHVMLHSDLGSMGWFDVQGDAMPLYDTILPNYQCKEVALPEELPKIPLEDSPEELNVPVLTESSAFHNNVCWSFMFLSVISFYHSIIS